MRSRSSAAAASAKEKATSAKEKSVDSKETRHKLYELTRNVRGERVSVCVHLRLPRGAKLPTPPRLPLPADSARELQLNPAKLGAMIEAETSIAQHGEQSWSARVFMRLQLLACSMRCVDSPFPYRMQLLTSAATWLPRAL